MKLMEFSILCLRLRLLIWKSNVIFPWINLIFSPLKIQYLLCKFYCLPTKHLSLTYRAYPTLWCIFHLHSLCLREGVYCVTTEGFYTFLLSLKIGRKTRRKQTGLEVSLWTKTEWQLIFRWSWLVSSPAKCPVAVGSNQNSVPSLLI